jgi:hypothetical protein
MPMLPPPAAKLLGKVLKARLDGIGIEQLPPEMGELLRRLGELPDPAGDSREKISPGA